MAVTTKKIFPATTNTSTTTFGPIGIELNNQDDLDVYVTESGGVRIMQLKQSTASTADSNHPQVNDTTGLYFPPLASGTSLRNYTISADNNNIIFNSALPNGAVVTAERRTRDGSGDYTSFAGGSTIRATQINKAFDEVRFTAQEGRNKAYEVEKQLDHEDITVASGKGVEFEGSTIDGNETRLVAADPTADRVITLPNVTGTVVTTGDTGSVTTQMIEDATIVNADIANTTITGGKLVNDTITATQIAANAVTSSELANDSVTGDHIVDNAINSEHYVDSSIDTQHIAVGQITTDRIANDAVDNTKIATNAVNSDSIQDGQVVRDKIANNAINADKILNEAVTTAKIAVGAVTATEIASNAVNTAEIVDQAVTSAKIADSTIIAGDIADNTITAAKMAPSSVTETALNASAVTTAKIGGGAVTTAKIANDAVTAAKLADDSVDTAAILDNNVTSAKIPSNAITAAKILDGNVTTAKLANDAVTGAKISDDSIDSEHIVDSSIDAAHLSTGCVTNAKLGTDAVTSGKIAAGAIGTSDIADNAVTTAKIADAELSTLADMQSGTASILAGSTALTADLSELNLLDGKSVVTTVSGSSNDNQLPTAKAVNDIVAALNLDNGNFVPINNEVSFPNTHPDPGSNAGTIVSIADAGGVVVNGSGVSTTGRTLAGTTVTINGIDSSLHNTTIAAGKGMLVQTTSTLNTYDYHRLVVDEAGVANAQSLVNSFNERYRTASSKTADNDSSNDDGDLFFDQGANKMYVYDGSPGSGGVWKEVTSAGEFKLLTVVPNGATSGSPTFNGTIDQYDLRDGSNASSITNAGQLIVSLNGVVQKPNASYDANGEGFALDGSNGIRFCDPPPSGSELFVTQIGSTVTLNEPADNSVSTVKIQNSAVTTAKIADDAITAAKIADGAIDAARIAANAVTATELADNAVDTAAIADDAVTAAKVADNCIVAAAISSNAVTTAKIPDDAITQAKIAAGAIGATELASNAVTNAKIADDAITAAEIADNAVVTAGILNANVTTAKIADNAVTTAKIANDSINTSKLENNAVTTAKIAADAINTSRLEDGAVTQAKLGNEAVNEAKIQISNGGTNGQYLQKQSGNTGGLTWADVPAGVGGATGLDLNDDVKVRWGGGTDLEIWHSNSDSTNYISSDLGGLWIKTAEAEKEITLESADDVHIKSGNAFMAKFVGGAGAELYYNNGLRLQTTANGVTLGADLLLDNAYNAGRDVQWQPSSDRLAWLDNTKAIFGDGADLSLWHDGTNSYIDNITNNLIIRDSGGGHLQLRGDDIQIMNQAGNETMANFNENSNVQLYNNGLKKLETHNTGIRVENTGSDVHIYTKCSTSGYNQLCFGDTDDDDRGSILYNHVGDTMQFTSGTEEKLRITPTTMSWYDGGSERLRFGTHGELGVAGAGSINYGSSGQVLTSGGSSAGMQWKTPGGKILQVLHLTKTDTWSQASIACGNVSNNAIQLDITPSASSSKVLVTVSVMVSFNSDANRVGAVLKRGGTELGIGDSAGNRRRVTGTTVGDNDTAVMGNIMFTYLDSPSTTSAITYGVGLTHGSGSAKTMYLNRGGGDSDACYRFRSGSHITLQEIAG